MKWGSANQPQLQHLYYLGRTWPAATNDEFKKSMLAKGLPPNYGAAMVRARKKGWWHEISKEILSRTRRSGLQRTYRSLIFAPNKPIPPDRGDPQGSLDL